MVSDYIIEIREITEIEIIEIIIEIEIIIIEKGKTSSMMSFDLQG